MWERDAARPGEHGFEPGLTAAAAAAHDALLGDLPKSGASGGPGATIGSGRPGRANAVLDCILLDPGQWWVGYHRVGRSRRNGPAG